MMTKNKPTPTDIIPGFDAVAESRKWKEAVWRETAGMTNKELDAYFKAGLEQCFAERRERALRQEHALAH